MSLKLRIFLIIVMPLLLMAAVISWLGTLHATKLANEQISIYEKNLMAAKQQELRNYLQLAQTAIASNLMQSALDEQAALLHIRDTLNSMTFGEDGYFFLYDEQGINLAHPRQPELTGQNLFDLQDKTGHFIIRELLAASARTDEQQHFVQYYWNKPSAGEERRKLGYVERLPRWNWMLGTGLYIDDIEKEVTRLRQGVTGNVRRNLMTTLAALVLTTLVIFLLMLFVNLHDGRQSSLRLQELAHNFVRLQVQERRQFSRELHDGINQLIVAAKFRIQSIVSQQKHNPAIATPLQESLSTLDEAIQEVRRISHALRPGLLDDLGLEQALASLLSQFQERTGIEAKWQRPVRELTLPDDVEITLYRVIQEALLNTEKHAAASQVELKIDTNRREVEFSFEDNGKGFRQHRPDEKTGGIGLTNMRERIELLGGQFTLYTEPGKGVRIHATLPVNTTLQTQITAQENS